MNSNLDYSLQLVWLHHPYMLMGPLYMCVYVCMCICVCVSQTMERTLS